MRQLFGCDYTTSYERAGLLGPRSVLAHNVHPTLPELLHARPVTAPRSRTARRPTPRSAAGSFPLGLAPRRSASGSALGSDVGAGTGFSLFKEGLQAYFVQQLLGREGGTGSPRGTCCTWRRPPVPTRSAWRTTVGDFSVGKEFDALWLRPSPGCTLDVALRHADSPEDALAKAFALAGPADVAATWVGGAPVRSPS